MSTWFKKLIEKFTGKSESTESTVTITSVDPRHDPEQYTVNVEEVVQQIKEDLEAIKSINNPYTFDQLMSMTKKEQIAYAEENGVAVKSHWTKKNIAAEIVNKLS